MCESVTYESKSITPSIFVEAEGTIATGAYDRLCDQQ
jgi:hypothetical protein